MINIQTRRYKNKTFLFMLLQRYYANENALREKQQPEIRLRSQAITKTFH